MAASAKVRLLGAALVLRGIEAVIGAGSVIVNAPSALERLNIWLLLTLDVAVGSALIWAGFAMASRRPSRRPWIAMAIIVAVVHEVYGVAEILGGPARQAGASSLLYPFLSFALYGIALVYLFRTRHDPQFKPRLDASPVKAEPTEAHSVVTAKIVDGPDWQKALLDSLHEAGMPDTPRPRRWPLVLAFAGLLSITAAVNRLLPEVIPPQWQAGVGLIVSMLSLVVISLPIARLRRRLLQMRARNAEATLKKAGAKRPTFYLRSFALDDEIGRPSVLELLFNFQPFNPEQQLTAVIARSGPVLAIGRPGEALPALGAARFYVAHELWQEKVADVATVSRLVVWASGTTLGLQWEITHLLRSLPPEKLVLWAHPHLLDLDEDEREAEWSRFVDGLGTLFPRPLPKPLGATRFFAFSPDFEPIAFGERRGSPTSAQSRALRALLQAKDIPPFDRVTLRRGRRIRRIAFATVGAVCAALAIGAGFLFWNHIRTAPPEPLAWNLLANDLLDDEHDQDYQWNAQTRSYAHVARTPQRVIEKLRGTVNALDGHWFGGNWNNVPPGRLPALQAVARHYLSVFEAAHANTTIERVLYGGLPIAAVSATSAADAEALHRTITNVRAALDAVDRDWAAIRPETSGWFYSDKMRGLVAARRELLVLEAALLRLLIDFPASWIAERRPNGEPMLNFSDNTVLERARILAGHRDAAAVALAAALAKQSR